MSIVPTIKVIVGGDLGTGKTCLTNFLLRSLFLKEYDAHIEDTLCKQIMVDGKPYNFEILDTVENEFRNGEDKIKIILKHEVLIYTYAINDATSFENLYRRYAALPIHEEDDHKKLVYLDGKLLRFPPIILVGTKLDMEGERQVAVHSAEKMKTELNFQDCIECSSFNNENIEELLALTIKHATEYQNSDNDLTHLYADDDSNEPKYSSGNSSLKSHLAQAQQKSTVNNTTTSKGSDKFPSIQEDTSDTDTKEPSRVVESSDTSDPKVSINKQTKTQTKNISSSNKPELSTHSCCTIM